jgi:hypothetical protein
MKKTSSILAATAVALLLPAALFAALSSGTLAPGATGLAMHVVERLDLGSEQTQHIRASHASHKAELTGEQARFKKAHVRVAIHADAFHETAFRVVGRAVGQAERLGDSIHA